MILLSAKVRSVHASEHVYFKNSLWLTIRCLQSIVLEVMFIFVSRDWPKWTCSASSHQGFCHKPQLSAFILQICPYNLCNMFPGRGSTQLTIKWLPPLQLQNQSNSRKPSIKAVCIEEVYILIIFETELTIQLLGDYLKHESPGDEIQLARETEDCFSKGPREHLLPPAAFWHKLRKSCVFPKQDKCWIISHV